MTHSSLPSPARDEEEIDETACVDLGVNFFCAVLMLFVFAAFNLDDDPRPETLLTLGQREETREIEPPAWSATAERGSFAIFHEGKLLLLDMASITAGIETQAKAYSGDNGFMLFQSLSESSPAAFTLTVNLAVWNPPAPWLRETLEPGPDSPCPISALRPIAVLVTPDAGDLMALQSYARRCGHRLRIEPVKAPTAAGMLRIPFGLSFADFSAEKMFR